MAVFCEKHLFFSSLRCLYFLCLHIFENIRFTTRIWYSHTLKFSLWKKNLNHGSKALTSFCMPPFLVCPAVIFLGSHMSLPSFTSMHICGARRSEPCEVLIDVEQWRDSCFAVCEHRCWLARGIVRSLAYGSCQPLAYGTFWPSHIYDWKEK